LRFFDPVVADRSIAPAILPEYYPNTLQVRGFCSAVVLVRAVEETLDFNGRNGYGFHPWDALR
jgi:hypothetical protein